jgi:hypothetical protein
LAAGETRSAPLAFERDRLAHAAAHLSLLVAQASSL